MAGLCYTELEGSAICNYYNLTGGRVNFRAFLNDVQPPEVLPPLYATRVQTMKEVAASKRHSEEKKKQVEVDLESLIDRLKLTVLFSRDTGWNPSPWTHSCIFLSFECYHVFVGCPSTSQSRRLLQRL